MALNTKTFILDSKKKKNMGQRTVWFSTWFHLPTQWHGTVLPAYVGIWGEAPRPVADSSRIPAEVVWVLQLWNHIHRQTVLVGNLQDKTQYRGEKVKENQQWGEFCWPQQSYCIKLYNVKQCKTNYKGNGGGWFLITGLFGKEPFTS